MRQLVVFAVLLGRLLSQGPGDAGALVVEAGDARVSAQTIASVHDLARKGLSRLAPLFPGTPNHPIKIVVHADVDSVPPALRDNLHSGTAGFALLGRAEARVLLDEAVREPPNDLRTVVEHELVHLLLDQCAGAAAPFVPRWVHEGMAQALSGGAYLAVQEENLLFAIATRTASRFSDLDTSFPARDDLLRLAYAQSFSFVAYLIDRFGVRTVVDVARACHADRPFAQALLDATDLSQARLQDDWERHVLYGGAAARYLLHNCFSFLMVLAVPLLVIAAVKRVRLDRQRKRQLAAEEPGLAVGSEQDDPAVR